MEIGFFTTIGQRVKFFREQKHITVNKLATLSGVSQSYVRDIELGKKQPTVEFLEYICFGLGITLQDFFSDDEKDDDLTKAIKKLTPQQRKMLTAFLESLHPTDEVQ